MSARIFRTIQHQRPPPDHQGRFIGARAPTLTQAHAAVRFPSLAENGTHYSVCNPKERKDGSTCREAWNRLLTGYVLDALEAGKDGEHADAAAVERLLNAIDGVNGE